MKKLDRQQRRDQFRELRKEANLSQSKLAFYMGLSERDLDRIETGSEGRSPTALHLRLAHIIVYICITDQLKGLAEILPDKPKKLSKQEKRRAFKSFRTNLKQKDIAFFLGISKWHTNRLERGTEDRSPTVLQLRAAEIVAYLATIDHLEGLAEFLDNTDDEE